MSTYATIEGRIQYVDKDSFTAAMKWLRDGWWMDSEGYFTDENRVRWSEEPDVHEKSRTVRIPYGLYRNLVRFLSESTIHPEQHHLFQGATGRIIWTSTDGFLGAGNIQDGVETYYDLSKWAKENGFEDCPHPAKAPDMYTDWLQEVENAFHGEFGE